MKSKGSKIVLGGHLVQFNRFTEEIELGNISKEKKRTKCQIFNKSGDKLSEEVASLHHNDTNDKSVGRYYAFRKAMTNLDANKEVKRKLWNDFRTKLKNPTPELTT